MRMQGLKKGSDPVHSKKLGIIEDRSKWNSDEIDGDDVDIDPRRWTMTSGQERVASLVSVGRHQSPFRMNLGVRNGL